MAVLLCAAESGALNIFACVKRQARGRSAGAAVLQRRAVV